MGLLVVKGDFTGVYALSASLSNNIDPYIAEYEKKYLRELLGADLFTLFEASVSAYVPVDPYLVLFNEINTDEIYGLLHSDGIKKMLLGFLWYEFATGTAHKHTDTGIVANINENAINADFSLAFAKYNKAIDSYRSIQYYIQKNIRDYPTFKGVPKRLISSL